MELVSGPISPLEILAEVAHITDRFRLFGIHELLVEYGWGCNTEADRMWLEVPINVDDVGDFVRASLDAGIFVPGSADLFVRDRNHTIEFRLCHESDIHLVTNDQRMIEQVTGEWISKRFCGYKRAEADAEWHSIC